MADGVCALRRTAVTLSWLLALTLAAAAATPDMLRVTPLPHEAASAAGASVPTTDVTTGTLDASRTALPYLSNTRSSLEHVLRRVRRVDTRALIGGIELFGLLLALAIGIAVLRRRSVRTPLNARYLRRRGPPSLAIAV